MLGIAGEVVLAFFLDKRMCHIAVYNNLLYLSKLHLELDMDMKDVG